ncbi:MAG: aconitase X [Candidatus Nitrosocosmicus sp.]|nr:aconitase X [Candidatus Nitrosocosmicus sp.]
MQKSCTIKWAHVSGVNYNTIGDSGLEFLREISKDGKVMVNTSLNPMAFDRENLPELSPEFIEKQFEIASAYEKIGVTPTFSCIPYEILPIPQEGHRWLVLLKAVLLFWQILTLTLLQIKKAL